MSAIAIEFQGLDVLDRKLSSLGDRLANQNPLFERIYQRDYLRIERERFDSEGYGQWPELSPAHAIRKRARYGDKKILQASERLVKSLTEENAIDSVKRINELDAEFGTSTPYAVYHNSREPRTVIPRRPVLEFRPEDVAEVQQTAREYMGEIARTAGFEVVTR